MVLAVLIFSEDLSSTTSISFPNMYAPGDIVSGDKSWEKEPLFRTEATDSWQSHQATMKKAYLVWLHFPSMKSQREVLHLFVTNYAMGLFCHIWRQTVGERAT